MKDIVIKNIILLFFIWGVITLTINTNDAQAFRLQNATIAALVNRHSFALKELDVPDFRLIVGQETFRVGEDIYPMKQPGQTILGALAYIPMKKLGITFEAHYLLTSSLITMLTSSLLIAIMGIVLWRVVSIVTKSEQLGLLVSLATIFSSIIWSYAGVTHHDIMGVFWISLSLYYFLRKNYTKAGIFSGFSIFFTMLTLPIPLALFIVSAKKWNTGAGIFLGILPIAVFNTWIFGNPWLSANLAGEVSDTVPLLSLSNFFSKLWFYIGSPQTSLWCFAPLTLLGVLGIWRNQSTNSALRRLLWLAPLAQIVYVSSIETFGGHQYGPRYLLPAIPFLMVSAGIWIARNSSMWQRLLFAFLTVLGVLIAGIGAIMTIMQPLTETHASILLARQLFTGEIPVYRVWKYGAVMVVLACLLLVVWQGRQLQSANKAK